jgi:hypothetical protein
MNSYKRILPSSSWGRVIIVALVFFVSFSTRITSYHYSHAAPSGATYYVSTLGSDSNPGSSSQPWRTIQKAADFMVAGDTVNVIAGDYSSQAVNVTKSGSSGSPITFQAQGTVVTQSFYVTANYIVIRGLTVKRSSGDAITIKGGDYVTIDSCVVEHPRGRGIMVDGYSNPVNNVTIKNTRVDTTANVNCVSPQQVDNLYLQYGSDPIIEGNIVINRGGCNVAGGPHVDNIQMYYMDNITIRNNHLEFVPGSGNDQSQSSMISFFDGFVKAYNNVVLTDPASQFNGLYFGYEDGGSGSEIYLWNNTIKAQHPNGTALRIDHIDPNSIKAIKNNILIAGDNGGYAIYADSGISNPSVVDNNILDNNGYSYGVAFAGTRMSWSAWQSNGFDIHGYNVDPGLDNNFEPDANNDPSADRGVTIPEFSIDIVGVVRPQGTSYDIGAFEYVGFTHSEPGDINLFLPVILDQ